MTGTAAAHVGLQRVEILLRRRGDAEALGSATGWRLVSGRAGKRGNLGPG